MKRDSHRPKPLYRRVNTRTWGVRHGSGQAARHERNTKAGPAASMHGRQRHGLDYTPLYKFLLKAVGRPWDDVFSEARPRIADEDALYHIVALPASERKRTVRVGESSYFSGLFVDDNGTLQRVDPNIEIDTLYPFCACCTHTFNGTPLTQKWSLETQGEGWNP